MKNIKKIGVLILSVCLIMLFAGSVFAADDDDLFKAVSPSNSESNSVTNANSANNTNTSNTVNNTSNTNSSLASNTNSSNTANNVANNIAGNTNSNTNRNAVNALAKTGLSNTGSVVALIVVVCGISAIYSYKKVYDYRRIK